MEKTKATLYLTGGLMGCPQKLEVHLLDHGTTEYAQYNAAPFVKYIVKGKRTPVKYIKGNNPFILIVKGWETPEPPSWHKPSEDNGLVIVQASKYSSFDDAYLKDFNTWFADFKDLEVIADYRQNKDVWDYDKVAEVIQT